MERVPHLEQREGLPPLQADVERFLQRPTPAFGDGPRVVLGIRPRAQRGIAPVHAGTRCEGYTGVPVGLLPPAARL